MSPVFINCTAETFTPTKSGAIATWIWEVCQAALLERIEPLVITRIRAGVAPYPWKNTIFVPYPEVPRIKGAGRLFKLQQRIQGWGHIRQGLYVQRIAKEIRRANVQAGPFVLQNDIEMAVYLKKVFPGAFLLHHTQNDNGVYSDSFRRRFRRAPDVASACSDWTRCWNTEYYGFAEGEMKTLYNGVDTVKFCPATREVNPVPVINFHGRIDENKAPDLLLKAALQLTKRTTHFAVQIVGRKYYWKDEVDDYQRSLLKLSEQLQDKGVKVNFTGWMDRNALPETLQCADIHVTTSRWDEPFGLTTIEAMSTGLATIGSDTGGTPEVIGEAGLLFARDDVEQLSQHLFELVTNHDLRRELGRRARQRSLCFTWRHTWNALKSYLPA